MTIEEGMDVISLVDSDSNHADSESEPESTSAHEQIVNEQKEAMLRYAIQNRQNDRRNPNSLNFDPPPPPALPPPTSPVRSPSSASHASALAALNRAKSRTPSRRQIEIGVVAQPNTSQTTLTTPQKQENHHHNVQKRSNSELSSPRTPQNAKRSKLQPRPRGSASSPKQGQKSGERHDRHERRDKQEIQDRQERRERHERREGQRDHNSAVSPRQESALKQYRLRDLPYCTDYDKYLQKTENSLLIKNLFLSSVSSHLRFGNEKEISDKALSHLYDWFNTPFAKSTKTNGPILVPMREQNQFPDWKERIRYHNDEAHRQIEKDHSMRERKYKKFLKDLKNIRLSDISSSGSETDEFDDGGLNDMMTQSSSSSKMKNGSAKKRRSLSDFGLASSSSSHYFNRTLSANSIDLTEDAVDRSPNPKKKRRSLGSSSSSSSSSHARQPSSSSQYTSPSGNPVGYVAQPNVVYGNLLDTGTRRSSRTKKRPNYKVDSVDPRIMDDILGPDSQEDDPDYRDEDTEVREGGRKKKAKEAGSRRKKNRGRKKKMISIEEDDGEESEYEEYPNGNGSAKKKRKEREEEEEPNLENESSIQCPLCSKSFPVSRIEAHANACAHEQEQIDINKRDENELSGHVEAEPQNSKRQKTSPSRVVQGTLHDYVQQ